MPNNYPEWQKTRCVHCRNGALTKCSDRFNRWHFSWDDPCNPIKCTAPTPEEYIAELEAAIAKQSRVIDDCNALTARLCVQLSEIESEREKWRESSEGFPT